MEAVLEECLVGESRSNGEIEWAAKEVKGFQSVLSDLEHKLKIEINRWHPILAWLQAPCGSDGRTAEERRIGHNWRRPCDDSESRAPTAWLPTSRR